MATTNGRMVSVPAVAGAATGAAVGAAASGPHTGTNNSNGSGSSGGNTESTAVSDYGVLLSEYANDPANNTPARPSTDMGFIPDSRGGHIIPPSELLRMENERMEQEQYLYGDEPRAYSTDEPQRYSPLAPPPPLDPDRLAPLSTSTKSSLSGISAHAMDDPMVMTARRVQMTQVGPRGSEESSPVATTSGTWGSLNLGGISRLSRLSWFKNLRENLQESPKSSRPTSYVGVPLSDTDVETGRASLGEELKRPTGLGFNAEGERPMSSVSTKSAMSGSTVYHDTYSSPGTPPPLPPLPRAYMTSQSNLTHVRSGSMAPPAYEAEQMTSPGGQNQVAKDNYAPRLVDVLDMPAPASISQFSSASSRGGLPFPPGLAQLPSWYASSSSEAGDNAGISIDVLEDAPPTAGDGWRVLARNTSLSHPEHRTSFGIVRTFIFFIFYVVLTASLP